MDPNETLKNLRSLTKHIIKTQDMIPLSFMDSTITAEDAVQMAEWFEALDGWLSKGGFLPGRWAR